MIIGLRGSYAKRLPRKWWTSPDAFPVTRLYLDLLTPADENDQNMAYNFKFQTPEQASADNANGHHWFLVSRAMDFGEASDIYDYIVDAGLAADRENKYPHRTLTRLHEMVTVDQIISYYAVEESELDKVLNIFIRVNSGGTVLSYSDLLLSIATAQWKNLDAREAIHNLVDELNSTGQGFGFTKDMVLKAGLVLNDLGDVGFRVSNFNRQNMELLEDSWNRVSRALRLGARLLASFGFSERTLSSDYVLIPVAYYLHASDLDAAYLTSAQHEADRRQLRTWVLRSLLKAGVWGSGQDTLLTRVRSAIQAGGQNGFPPEAIETEMAKIGKSLAIGPVELDEILDLQYGKPQAFVALAMLYPNITFQSEVHVDHIFPRSRFTRARLSRAGVPDAEIQDFIDLVNGLPNLQLLPGTVNVQKQDVMPLDWVRQLWPGEDEQHEAARDSHLAMHDMLDLPEEIVNFPFFYEQRKARMRARLGKLLNAQAVTTPQTAAP